MGLAGSGQLIGSAMVNRGADDGQAQGDVNRVMKMDQLNGNEPLVMVHGDHRIEFPFVGPMEKGVGRQWANYLKGLSLESPDHRLHELHFLAAEETLLTGMGVETGHPEAHGFQTKVAQEGFSGNVNRTEEQISGQDSRNLSQGMMDSRQRYPQARSCKHHDHLVGTREFLQEFGMTREREAMPSELGLVYGAGADGVHPPRKSQAGSFFDIADHRQASSLRWLPVNQVFPSKMRTPDYGDDARLGREFKRPQIIDRTNLQVRSNQIQRFFQSVEIANYYRCAVFEDSWETEGILR